MSSSECHAWKGHERTEKNEIAGNQNDHGTFSPWEKATIFGTLAWKNMTERRHD